MCAGQWLLRDGEILHVDEEAVRSKVAEAAAHLWEE
jgi:hypothetical protein